MPMVRYFQVGKTSGSLESIPFPTSVKWSYNEISTDKSGRSKSGKMNKRIVAAKRTLECEWTMLEDEVSSAMLQKIKAYTYIYLKYMDPFEGKDVVKKFYTSDPSAEERFLSSEGKYYWNVSFSFIEQ